MDLIIITILIAMNGFFALAEIAIISCRKSRLEHAAEQGRRRAKIVLSLLKQPEQFLSALQVGITFIGIVSGAYSGVALAEDLRPFIALISPLQPYAGQIAMVLLIIIVTFFSIVFGELIPKTIALSNPEPIAYFIAPFIAAFTRITYPAVILLSCTTRLVKRGLRIRDEAEQKLSEEELLLMIKMASRQGVLQQEEMQFHENLFMLSDKRAFHIMTRRADVDTIDISLPRKDIEDTIRQSMHSCFPVYEKNIDNIVGMLRAKDFFAGICDPAFNPREALIKTVYLPERLKPLQIVKIFKKTKNYFGIVVNEYGGFEGVLTLHDLIEHVLGDMPEAGEQQHIMELADGALLIDGDTPPHEIISRLHLEAIAEQLEKHATIAGFIYEQTQNIPTEGIRIPLESFLIEIVDMDGPRIDKIMIHKNTAALNIQSDTAD